MQKPVRYLLICLALTVSVCLLAIASALYVVDPQGNHFEGWGTSLDVGGGHRLYLSIRSTLVLGYDLSFVSVVPISWFWFVLVGLALPALACLGAAGVLARPLFSLPRQDKAQAGKVTEPRMPQE